jgi:hypothetical protein
MFCCSVVGRVTAASERGAYCVLGNTNDKRQRPQRGKGAEPVRGGVTLRRL